MKNLFVILVALTTITTFAKSKTELVKVFDNLLEAQPQINKVDMSPDFLKKARKPGHIYKVEFYNILEGRGKVKCFLKKFQDFNFASKFSWRDEVISNNGKKIIIERKFFAIETIMGSGNYKKGIVNPLESLGSFLDKYYKKRREEEKKDKTITSRKKYSAKGSVPFIKAEGEYENETTRPVEKSLFYNSIIEHLKSIFEKPEILTSDLSSHEAKENLEEFNPTIKEMLEKQNELSNQIKDQSVTIIFEAGKGITKIDTTGIDDTLTCKRIRQLVNGSSFINYKLVEQPIYKEIKRKTEGSLWWKKAYKITNEIIKTKWEFTPSMFMDILDINNIGGRTLGSIYLRKTDFKKVNQKVIFQEMINLTTLPKNKSNILCAELNKYKRDFNQINFETKSGKASMAVKVKNAALIIDKKEKRFISMQIQGKGSLFDQQERNWQKDLKMEVEPNVTFIVTETELGN